MRQRNTPFRAAQTQLGHSFPRVAVCGSRGGAAPGAAHGSREGVSSSSRDRRGSSPRASSLAARACLPAARVFPTGGGVVQFLAGSAARTQETRLPSSSQGGSADRSSSSSRSARRGSHSLRRFLPPRQHSSSTPAMVSSPTSSRVTGLSD